MSFCHHAVVGVLLVHQGRIAVAMRQKPPLNRAPSAGHVEPEDGLVTPFVFEGLTVGRLYRWTHSNAAFERCAVREGREETGFLMEEKSLQHLLTYQAGDDCAKTGAEGEPGGRHIWQVFAHKIEMISQPTLTDEPGKNSCPITGATFILMRKTQADPAKAKEVLKFFEWAYQNGDAMALELDYIPMPDDVVKLVQSAWKNQIKDPSGKSIW